MKRLGAFLLLVVVGCAGDKAEETGHTHEHSETCGEPGETYTAGMTKTGDEGVLSIVIAEADPAPPDKGDNVWILEISDASTGDGVDDATVTIRPYMPEHGHGTSPEYYDTTATGADGLYESATIDLFMGGLWDLTVGAELTDGTTGSATFTFCLEG